VTEQLLDESWATSAGLPLAGGQEVTIKDFSFGFNTKLGENLCANIIFTIDETGDEADQWFSCGKGWEAVDRGARAVKNSGNGKQTFNNQTNFGRLIDSVANIGAGPAIGARGPATSAATWIGTKWTTDTTPVKTTNPATGAESVKDAVVFVAFNGVVEGQAAAATNGASKAAGGKTKSKAAAELDADLLATLTELASTSTDHDDFMGKALDIAAVADSVSATNAVCDAARWTFGG
jgi:hypothetical protein